GGAVGQSLNGSGYNVWRNIIKVGNDLDKIRIHLSLSFEWEVGNGKAIMFWEDNWIGMGKLRDLFSRRIPVRVVLDSIVEDVLNLAQANIFTRIKRDIWKGIVWSVLYIIWTFRNQVVFKGNEPKIPDLFKKVQGRAFEWIAARMKKGHLKWEDYISGAKKEWGLSPKAKVRVLHTVQLDVTVYDLEAALKLIIDGIIDKSESFHVAVMRADDKDGRNTIMKCITVYEVYESRSCMEATLCMTTETMKRERLTRHQKRRQSFGTARQVLGTTGALSQI
nr:hypothetical protein [Tanacetum cinerariifolium]